MVVHPLEFTLSPNEKKIKNNLPHQKLKLALKPNCFLSFLC